MANIDPIRRAEIGRLKRARTRAQLVAAASALFAHRAVESVTVDDVVREAGTFCSFQGPAGIGGCGG